MGGFRGGTITGTLFGILSEKAQVLRLLIGGRLALAEGDGRHGGLHQRLPALYGLILTSTAQICIRVRVREVAQYARVQARPYL
jgi:hypothetical protein